MWKEKNTHPPPSPGGRISSVGRNNEKKNGAM
jgi:hypothetical protein